MLIFVFDLPHWNFQMHQLHIVLVFKIYKIQFNISLLEFERSHCLIFLISTSFEYSNFFLLRVDEMQSW